MADQITSDEEDKMVQSSSSDESTDDEDDSGDVSDGIKMGKLKKNFTRRVKPRESSVKIPSNEDYYNSDSYDFTHKKRGLAVIINNEKFQKKSEMNSRSASGYDAKALEKMFRHLNFTVKRYNNLKAKEMVTKLKKAAANINFDHSNADCFACAILSHGNNIINPATSENTETRLDVVYGVDGVLVITKYILELFSDFSCPELIGKPRLFFIQACRGIKTDKGFEKKVIKDKVSPGPGGDKTDPSRNKDVGDSQEEHPTEAGDCTSSMVNSMLDESKNLSESHTVSNARHPALGKKADQLDDNKNKSTTTHSAASESHPVPGSGEDGPNKSENISATHTATSGSKPVPAGGEDGIDKSENLSTTHTAISGSKPVPASGEEGIDKSENLSTTHTAISGSKPVPASGEDGIDKSENLSTTHTAISGSEPVPENGEDKFDKSENISSTHTDASGIRPVPGSDENADEYVDEESDFDSDSPECEKAEDSMDHIKCKKKTRKHHKVVTLVPAPLFRDFLLMYATPPGYYAWRRSNGTWFIQTLTDQMMKASKENLVKTLTRVSKTVALNFISRNKDEELMDAKKQVPCILSMLTKDIYFTQK